MAADSSAAVRWFAVRCVFATGVETDGVRTYEERITLWQATGFDEAIALAEAEAIEYAAAVELRSLGLAQCHELADDVADGAEVFSLMRDSRLEPTDYLTAFFDSGGERQRSAPLPD